MADPIIDQALSPWAWIVPANTVLIVLTGIAAWLFSRGGKEAVLAEQVRAAKESLEEANSRASVAVKANIELLERLHAHMLSDAGAFAKLEALTAEAARTGVASEMRLSTALDKLVTRIDSMTERFDQFITRIAPLIPPQQQQPQPPPQTPQHDR